MSPIVPVLTIAALLPLAHPLAPNLPVAAETAEAGRAAEVPVVVLKPHAAATLPGATHPEHRSTLGVPFDATLMTIPVEEGRRVKAGEIIVVLDDRVAREALSVSEVEASHTASVDRARAVLERAEESLDRAEHASNSDAMGAERLSEIRHRRDVAAADLRFAEEVLEKARAQLGLARARLEEHRIRAPFDGVVARVHADAGEVLSPGEPVAEIIDPDHVLVDLHLPARDAIALRPGDRVALALAEPIGAAAVGIVRYAEPRVDPASRTTRVVFAFEAPSGSIPAGVEVTPADRVPGHADAARLREIALARAARTPGGGSAVVSVTAEAE